MPSTMYDYAYAPPFPDDLSSKETPPSVFAHTSSAGDPLNIERIDSDLQFEVEDVESEPVAMDGGSMQEQKHARLPAVPARISTPHVSTAPQMNKSPAQQNTLPPPYKAKLWTPNPLAPAQPGVAFCPLLDQTALQRQIDVEYKVDFFGPPHAGRCSVTCVANGIQKGTGSSAYKQMAKEEAARVAYCNIGW
ncbi:hypothetical protein CPB85DRAFT_1438416 [Mucidula mucida]|nr:hypothetical protein CPB85DRAFT_1438416 [Mucidula mucida]